MRYAFDRPRWSPAIMFHGGGDGERIVAFGRAGKSPENPFFRHFAGPSGRQLECRKTRVFRNGF